MSHPAPMNLPLYQLNCGAFVHPDDPGEPGLREPRWSITENEGQLLAELVAGKSVLEIGTGLGVSTAYLASSATTVYTYDIDEWVRRTVYPLFQNSNVVCVYDLNLVPDVDVVFIDALHSAQAVEQDTRMALSKYPDMIIYHDAKMEQVKAGASKIFESA